MKKLLVLCLFCWTGMSPAHAEGLQWDIPGRIGTVQLPGSFQDVIPMIGYDAVKKQLIAGPTASLVTLWKEIDGYAGAVGEWNTQAANVQPYLAIGSDFVRFIPALNQIKSLQIHAFVRYVSSSDKHLGAGGALAYKF